MKEFTLLEYVKAAKDLEVAIYTQREFINTRDDELFELYPEEPAYVAPKAPSKPYPHSIRESSHYEENEKSWFIGGLVTLGAMLYSMFALADDGGILFSLAIFLPVAIALFVIGGIQGGKAEKARAAEDAEYQERLDDYNKALKEYECAVERSLIEHEAAMDRYHEDVSEHNAMVARDLEPHEDALAALQEDLDFLYDSDIIFPKYRSLIAITAIYEYLSSGRCSSLEGADGAYNLYEMELRQNIIIGQLSVIVDDLESIKDNQYILYQELKQANNALRKLSCNNSKHTENMIEYYNHIENQRNQAKAIALGLVI